MNQPDLISCGKPFNPVSGKNHLLLKKVVK
jgi:hypothetical protein